MTTTHEVVTGETGPYDFYLRDDGAIPSGTLTGTVSLVLVDQGGTQLELTGNLSIYDAANWIVRLLADASDLPAGVYSGRVKRMDTGGLVTYFPRGVWDAWVVRSVS